MTDYPDSDEFMEWQGNQPDLMVEIAMDMLTEGKSAQYIMDDMALGMGVDKATRIVREAIQRIAGSN